MRISFLERSGQSKAPTKTKATSTRGDEAQSFPVAIPSTSTQASHSMFGASLQSMIEKVVTAAVNSLQTSMIASLNQISSDLETEIGRLVDEVNNNYNRLVETQDAHD